MNRMITISEWISIDLWITAHSPILHMAGLVGNSMGVAIITIEIPGHSGKGVSGTLVKNSGLSRRFRDNSQLCRSVVTTDAKEKSQKRSAQMESRISH